MDKIELLVKEKLYEHNTGYFALQDVYTNLVRLLKLLDKHAEDEYDRAYSEIDHRIQKQTDNAYDEGYNDALGDCMKIAPTYEIQFERLYK